VSSQAGPPRAGGETIISALDRVEEALAGRAGTRVTP